MRWAPVLIGAIAWLAVPDRADALGCSIAEIRDTGGALRAVLEVRDAFASERFRELVEGGGTLFLRLQTDLWEDRPVWDKLAQPAAVTVMRVLRDPDTQAIAVQDSAATTATYADFPRRLPVVFDLGPTSALQSRGRYYIHAQFTVGTVEDRDIEEANDAVFGREDEGLRAVGRFFFRKILQISDYLQSASCALSSRKFTSADLRRRP